MYMYKRGPATNLITASIKPTASVDSLEHNSPMNRKVVTAHRSSGNNTAPLRVNNGLWDLH